VHRSLTLVRSDVKNGHHGATGGGAYSEKCGPRSESKEAHFHLTSSTRKEFPRYWGGLGNVRSAARGGEIKTTRSHRNK